MKHNLFTPMHGALNYPHYTQLRNGVANVVTHPRQIIEANDIIYSHSDDNRIELREHKVLEVLEQRSARGEHTVDFKPIFQKLKVVPV